MGVRCFTGLVAFVLVAVSAGVAPAQGIGYSATPTIGFVRWDSGLGVSNTYLYGGRVSFDFGTALSLGGFYLTRRGAETDAAAAFPDLTLTDRELDISHFGADVTINLGSAAIVPFLRGGGGILRFRPEGALQTDQIVVKAGGGLRLKLVHGIEGELLAEDWIFRLNRHRLFNAMEGSPGFPADPDSEDLRHNVAVSLGLRIPFGGDHDHRSDWLRGPALSIEPYVGRLRFDGDLTLSDQNLLGARAGLDLTRHFGLRGYYWRGVASDFTDTEPIQSFGGEAQFNLNTGPGVSPYLVAGLGRLDFRPEYRDELNEARADETMLILGGGISLGLSERFRLNIGLRDYIFGTNALEDVARTDDLFHSWMLSAGLTFNIGGRTAHPRVVPVEDQRLRTEVERLRAENQRLLEERERALRAADPDVAVRAAPDEVELIEPQRFEEVRVREADRLVTLPIPHPGEIIIRYGVQGDAVAAERPQIIERAQVTTPAVEGMSLSPAEIRQLVRDALQEELVGEQTTAPTAAQPAPVPGTALTEERLAQLEQRLANRLEEMVLRRQVAVAPGAWQQPGATADAAARAAAISLERRIDLLERRLMSDIDQLVERRLREELERQRMIDVPLERPAPVPRPVPGVAPPVEPPPPATRRREPLTLDPDRTRAFTGIRFGDPQALLGARLDFGPVSDNIALDLVPEISVGYGDGTSLLLAGNLQYDFDMLTRGSPVAPFVNGGIGLLTAEGLVINLGYGFHADLGRTRWGPVTGFAEHNGLGGYRIHRLLAGVRMGL